MPRTKIYYSYIYFRFVSATAKNYIITHCGLNEVSVELELQQIGTYISHKICELNKAARPTSLKNKKKMITSCGGYASADIVEVQVTEGLHDNKIPSEVLQERNKEDSDEGKEDEKDTHSRQTDSADDESNDSK